MIESKDPLDVETIKNAKQEGEDIEVMTGTTSNHKNNLSLNIEEAPNIIDHHLIYSIKTVGFQKSKKQPFLFVELPTRFLKHPKKTKTFL